MLRRFPDMLVPSILYVSIRPPHLYGGYGLYLPRKHITLYLIKPKLLPCVKGRGRYKSDVTLKEAREKKSGLSGTSRGRNVRKILRWVSKMCDDTETFL